MKYDIYHTIMCYTYVCISYNVFMYNVYTTRYYNILYYYCVCILLSLCRYIPTGNYYVVMLITGVYKCVCVFIFEI